MGEKQVKDIGYKVLSYEAEPYEKKKRKVSSILERNNMENADNYYRGNFVVAAGFFITF